MIIIPLLIFIIYLFVFLKFKTSKKVQSQTSDLKISVIVAAKNEMNNLRTVYNSLVNQDFPSVNYEVIFIDDNSTDSTFNILSEITKGSTNISVIKANQKKYEGKRGALQIGIDNSKYNKIVITDADCEVGSGFLQSYADQFNIDNKFVFGIAPYIQTKSFVNNLACFDNFWVHLLTFSFSYNGLPYSAAARSLGFDKLLFEEIDGYKNTTETLSGDDDLLLREVIKNNSRIGIITNEKAFVFSKTKEKLKEFINQKSRHTSTSIYYTSTVKFILGVWHLTNLFMLISIFLVSINILYLYLFLFKVIMDVFIVKNFMKMFSYNFTVSQIIFLQLLYELFLIVYFVKGLLRKPKW